MPTAPAQVYVDIVGHSEKRIDFLNFQLGCIEGYKYEDMNGNGHLDAGDTPIEGWQVYLYGPRDTLMTTTDADGYYRFCGLGPGMYEVVEESRSGWIATTADSEDIQMMSGATVRVHDFLNFELGSICGYKFQDENSNGIWDIGEDPIEGWEINLMGTDGPGWTTVYTDKAGRFCFSGLDADMYLVWEASLLGWTHTTSDYAFYELTSGSHFEVPAFGNFKDVEIEVYKYEDVNGNTVYDFGDSPIEGWMFTVSGPCFAVPWVMYTDETGHASVMVTAAGTYTATEEDRAGWIHMQNPTGSEDVEVTSGDEFAPLVFGNFELGSLTLQKFYDWDGDQVMDGDEVGLMNWVLEVEIFAYDGSHDVITLLTGSGGYAYLTGLLPGTYIVSERLDLAPPGWTPTTPPSVEFDLTSGQAMSVSFGNMLSRESYSATSSTTRTWTGTGTWTSPGSQAGSYTWTASTTWTARSTG